MLGAAVRGPPPDLQVRAGVAGAEAEQKNDEAEAVGDPAPDLELVVVPAQHKGGGG